MTLTEQNEPGTGQDFPSAPGDDWGIFETIMLLAARAGVVAVLHSNLTFCGEAISREGRGGGGDISVRGAEGAVR